jgi:molecular chaperone IbpA
MTTIDFTPLFRSAIGFDRLANQFESAFRNDATGYPPYNIELMNENHYNISIAVAGFAEEELDLEVKDNILKVSGKKQAENEDKKYLHRGIANRSFERSFQLADYVYVESADLKDGLLKITLIREIPEASKPRRIQIKTTNNPLLQDQAEDDSVKAA